MSSMEQPMSLGSGEGAMRNADMDDRKRKRMISNRESARRSRMKKQQQVEGLIGQVAELYKENKAIEEKVMSVEDMYVGMSNENNVLRAQLAELADRLRSLNSVLHVVEEFSGLVMDIPEIPETLMEPWRLPCPASSNMFRC